MSGKILGIDLGTSNTAACICNDGKLDMIPSNDGASQYGKSFPSYVAITKNDELLVGEPAKKYGNKFPENTISEIKRHMGDKNFNVEIQGKKLSPQQVSAHILKKVKEDAYVYTGEDIKDAIITVPAYFDNNQRTATIDAGRIAGLNVKKLIDEPSAASIAYGIDKQEGGDDLNILVFDIGGGTLDVSIMDLFNGNFHVQAVGGDIGCGGADMDTALMYYIAGEFEKEHGIALLDDHINRELLKRDAEEAKINLSTSFETDVYERRIAEKNNESIDLDITITRSKLEEVISPIVEKFGAPIQDALDDALMTAEDIDKVILVGGPTRMPIVRRYVEDYLGMPAEVGIDPMESVCKGAAIYGNAILNGDGSGGGITVVHPVNPLSLGTEVHDGSTSVIINKNVPLPISKSRKYTTVRDNQTSVTINVVQGERIMAIDNTEIGSFILSGIPPAKRGVPQIEVTFKVDENGILKASAVEKVTGIKQSITIEGAMEMSDAEIERCIREAEEFENIDKPKPIIQKAINDANYAIETAEKILNNPQFESRISASDRDKIQNFISKLENAIVNKTLLELNVLTASLNSMISKFSSN